MNYKTGMKNKNYVETVTDVFILLIKEKLCIKVHLYHMVILKLRQGYFLFSDGFNSSAIIVTRAI